MKLLDVFVPGRPAPKGSMKDRGNGTMVNDNPATRPWQSTVADVAREAVASCPGRPGAWVWREGYPHDGPVAVWLDFWFQRPVKPRFATPATRDTGDIDKLVRCVFDALEEAKVITDDARVVSLVANAQYALGVGAGVSIRIYDESGEE